MKKDARICISPIEQLTEFGQPVRVAASASSVEGCKVLIEFATEREKIKILCTPDWALSLSETLKARATETISAELQKTDWKNA